MKKFFALTFIYLLVVSSAYAEVSINESNFPDRIFRSVVGNSDRNDDGILSDAEIRAIDLISVSGRNIDSLQGIEYLTSLKTLYCDRNNLETLDLSRNTNLETLYCISNDLRELNITGCTRLKEIYCYLNELESLNVTDKPYLVSLDCQENRIKNLDVSKNLMLEFLDCSSNDLTSLNLTENTNLKRLYCRDLNIANGILDVSKNTELTHLWCWNDGLTSINFPEGVTLRSFIADDNDLSNIDPLYSLVSNPLELSIRGNDKITTSTHLIALSDFVVSDDEVILDIGNYYNISRDSITGYNSSLEKLTFASRTEDGFKFSSQPEVIAYRYDTGIPSLRMTCVAYRAGSDIKDRLTACFSGILVGTEDNGVISWKGIPYAKAPVDTLRWKAPEALTLDTTTVYSASEFAPAALQPKSEFTPSSITGDMSENCLYLNIWNADNDSDELKPVVVWIHGGAFQAGATSNFYYSGEKFARDNPDIIFVSVGYRLGLMGFIDFSQVSGGENYPDSGNLGLLDMLAALRWLNTNIASFGGDRNRITLMGQSSGAACISMLMTIPESKTLFKRAILESGTVSMHTRKADALPLAQLLLQVTGKTDMAGLASLTQDELLDAIETLRYSTNFPETDEQILSKDLYSSFAKNAGDFDLLIGTNSDELNYWRVAYQLLGVGEDSFNSLMSGGFQLTEYAIGQYSSEDVMTAETFAYITSNDYPEFFNEICFRGPAIRLAESHTGNTYMYYWEYPVQLVPGAGATHEAELAYFLDNPALVNVLVPAPDSGVQRLVQSLVSSFIKTGNPSAGSVTWPKYDSNTRATMIFTDSGNTEIDYDPLRTERELISPLLKWGVSGRELVNGDLSSGISVDPDAAPKPEPVPEPTPDPEPVPEPEPEPTPDPEPEPTPKPQTIGRNGGGCDSGISIVNAFILLFFMMRKKNHNA